MSSFKGISPILRHALESFEHGVLHYLDGTEIGRKFALLHVDHSIELVLKEKVVQTGHSIFRKDGRTISVHEAFSILSNNGVSVPEKPRLEDLHDFRNIVQHKGLTPDEHTAEFYITEAYQFMKRFLTEELRIELGSYLPRPYVKAMEGLEPEEEKVMEEVRRRFLHAEQLFSSGAYEMAVISAFTALEITVREKAHEARPSTLVSLVGSLVSDGKIDDSWVRKFKRVANLRNLAAHTGEVFSREQARESLDLLNEIIDALPD